MGIFNDDNSLAAQWAQRKARLVSTRLQLKTIVRDTGNWVWNNQGGKTPQEVLDVIGTDAVGLFALSAKAVELLSLTGDDLRVVPPGYEYRFNLDGSVTVTAEPVDSSSFDSSESVSSEELESTEPVAA